MKHVSRKYRHFGHNHFHLRGVLSFVSSGLDINSCVLTYFWGTASLQLKPFHHYYRQVKVVCLLDLVHVLLSVLFGHVRWADVQFEVGPKVFKIIIVWEL